LFCDLDGASLATIAEDARALWTASDRVRLVQGDGVSTLEEELARLSDEEASGTFLHVDPYRPLEPGCAGETPLDLFARRGAGGGAHVVVRLRRQRRPSRRARSLARMDLGRSLVRGGVLARRGSLGGGLRPGVLGCGVVMCNVGEEALAACSRLGEGLAQAYAGARLPNGHDGALEFEEGTF
jgi:hypothetical protein